MPGYDKNILKKLIVMYLNDIIWVYMVKIADKYNI